MSENNIKVTSLRLAEQDLKQFKAYAEELGLNQSQAFSSLISLVELEKAKNSLTDRAKSIEVFRDTVNSLLNFYINALEENSRAEETIRQEFSKQLDTKDKTIVDLQEKSQVLSGELTELKEHQEEQNQAINNYNKDIEVLNKSLEDKQKQLTTLEQNNAMLQEQLKEYKEYRENYKALEQKIKNLEEQLQKADAEHKKQIESLKEDNTSYINNIALLEEKLKSNAEMLDFYKKQINIKDNELKESRADAKAKEEEHKQELAELKADYRARLDALKPKPRAKTQHKEEPKTEPKAD